MSFIEGRPELTAPAKYRPMVREGGGEYAVAMGLRVHGLEVQTQRRVGPYLIDCAVWPVAFEVWSTSSNPHKYEGQRRKIVYLIEQGWTVCYLHMHSRNYVRHLDGAIFEGLPLIWETANHGAAPCYFRVKRLAIKTTGRVVNGKLVTEPSDWKLSLTHGCGFVPRESWNYLWSRVPGGTVPRMPTPADRMAALFKDFPRGHFTG